MRSASRPYLTTAHPATGRMRTESNPPPAAAAAAQLAHVHVPCLPLPAPAFQRPSPCPRLPPLSARCGEEGGGARLRRACAAGAGYAVCAAAAAAWSRRWSLPLAPQVGAVAARAGRAAVGTCSEGEGGGGGGAPLSPAAAASARRPPRQGFLWEIPVAFRCALAGGGEESGRGCTAGGCWEAARSALRQPRRAGAAPPSAAASGRRCPCRALLPAAAVTVTSGGEARRPASPQRRRRLLRGVEVLAGPCRRRPACCSLPGCVTTVKAKRQGYMALGSVLPRSRPNSYSRVSLEVNFKPVSVHPRNIRSSAQFLRRVPSAGYVGVKRPVPPAERTQRGVGMPQLTPGVETPVVGGELQQL